MARFAHASIWRVLGIAALFGILAGFIVSWLATARWAPVLDEAVASLPETGTIANGTLRWPEPKGRLLAANQFTAIEIALEEFRTDSPPVDIAFELHTNRMVIRSVFGNSAIPYPATWRFEINRPTLLPIWGAWKAPILFGLIPGTMLALLISWALLALPYSLVARTLGGLAGRDMDFRDSWKMCVAAQLFGGLIMSFALGLYAAGQISLIFVAVLLAAHFVPTFFYVLISPFCVPKAVKPANSKKNPFDGGGRKVRGSQNPFAGEDD